MTTEICENCKHGWEYCTCDDLAKAKRLNVVIHEEERSEEGVSAGSPQECWDELSDYTQRLRVGQIKYIMGRTEIIMAVSMKCEHDFPTLREANVNQSSHHNLSVYCRKCGVAKTLAKIDRHR